MSERIDSVDLLVEPFRSYVKQLVEQLAAQNSKLKVFETMRTQERQAELFRQGKSKTMNSKHLEGKAADFVVFDEGQWSWDDKKYASEYTLLGVLVGENKGLVWGGNFPAIFHNPHALVDKPHVQEA